MATKNRGYRSKTALTLVAFSMLALAGCNSDDDETTAQTPNASTSGTSSTPESSPPPVSSTPNRNPTISGSAQTKVTAGSQYNFTPAAIDPDQDHLGFSIANRPQWATFDTATGRLFGTPKETDVGSFSNIKIAVSDSSSTIELPVFSITVASALAAATTSATIAWIAPTENEDGSALTDLAGYKILYGTSPDTLTQTVSISNVGLTSYVISNLSAGTYYFAIQAVNAYGAHSSPSAVAESSI